jgi:hypothetical protein
MCEPFRSQPQDAGEDPSSLLGAREVVADERVELVHDGQVVLDDVAMSPLSGRWRIGEAAVARANGGGIQDASLPWVVFGRHPGCLKAGQTGRHPGASFCVPLLGFKNLWFAGLL